MHSCSLSVPARQTVAISLLGKTKNSVKFDFWTWIHFKERLRRLVLWVSAGRAHYRSVYCLGCIDLSRKMSDIPEGGMGTMACELHTFDSCLRFHVAYDTLDKCAPCRHKEGH